jgi:hypothetical protein
MVIGALTELLYRQSCKNHTPSYIEIFCIVDGTHGTNIYGMTLLLPCTNDYMGKTKIVGVILCHNKSHEDTLVGLKMLELGKEAQL